MKRIQRQRHKRHFQLLELMVAAFILLICIAPTMRIFTSMYQSQQEIIRENQRDHLAHLVHAKFIEQLYKRQISLEEVMQSKIIALTDPELISQLQKFAYECVGTFIIVDSYTPRNQEKPTMYLAQLVIKLKDISPKAKKHISNQKIENQDPIESYYDYFVYIDAGEMDKRTDNEQSADQETDSSNNSPTQPQPPSPDANKKVKKDRTS
jgi:Tfp pilus assembly protein PilE